MPEVPKAYEPQAVEAKWYDFWLQNRCFVAEPASKKVPYSIVIPPPNVTGVLTLGHVLNNTIQDILSRKARMEGFEVLWLPGTDHAGIATQTAVETNAKYNYIRDEQRAAGRPKSEVLPLLPYSKEPRLPPLSPPAVPLPPPLPTDSATGTTPSRPPAEPEGPPPKP